MFNNDNEIIKLKLFEAVDDNELDELKLILDGIPLRSTRIKLMDQTNRLKRNLLHNASFNGNYMVAQYILEVMNDLDINIDKKDQRGYTASNLAMIKGFIDFSLYDNEETQEASKVIAFEDDTQSRRYLIIKAIYNFNGDTLKHKSGQNTGLHWACYHNDKQAIRFFLQMDKMEREKLEGKYTGKSRTEAEQFGLLFKENQRKLFPIDIVKKYAKKGKEHQAKEILDRLLLTMKTNLKKEKEKMDNKDIPHKDRESQKIESKIKKALNDARLYSDTYYKNQEKKRNEKNRNRFKLTNKKMIGKNINIKNDDKEDIEHKEGDETHKDDDSSSKNLENNSYIEKNKEVVSEKLVFDTEPNGISTKQKKVYVLEDQYTYQKVDIAWNRLSDTYERFYNHLLYWSVESFDSNTTDKDTDTPNENSESNKELFMRLLLDKNCSPFERVIDGKCAFHRACQLGNLKLVNFILKCKYNNFYRANDTIEKSQYINLPTYTTYETPLHLAIGSKKYKVAKLLILNGANAQLTDYRGWKPLDLQVSEEVDQLNSLWRLKYQKKEMTNTTLNDLERIESMMFINYKSGYQYVLRAYKEKESIEKCIVYKQLLRIQENEGVQDNGLKNKDYKFKFFAIETMATKNYYFIAIKVCQDLLSEYAEKLKIKVFDRENGFFDNYVKEKADSFEKLRDKHIQRIILHILESEFHIESYMNLKIIKEHFPLHDLYKRQLFIKSWSLGRVLCMSILFGGHQTIGYVNTSYQYLGSNLGYTLAFSLSIKSFLHIYTLFYFIFLLSSFILPNTEENLMNYLVQHYDFLNTRYFVQTETSTTIHTYIIIFCSWFASLALVIFWKRKVQELNYLWDIRSMKLGSLLKPSRISIDKITGCISDERIHFRITDYFTFYMLFALIINLLQVVGVYIVLEYYINEPYFQFVEEYVSLLTIDRRLIIKTIFLGCLNGISNQIVNYFFWKARPRETAIAGDFAFFFLNYYLPSFMIIYTYGNSTFKYYFLGLSLTIMVIHLVNKEFLPRSRFKYNKLNFKRNWPKLKKKMIDNFLKNIINLNDFCPEEEERFQVFKTKVMIRRQFEFNQRCLERPNIEEDLFTIFMLYLYTTMFSLNEVGYYIPIMLVFLTWKISLMMNRCFIYCKRQLASEEFDIKLLIHILEMVSFLMPIQNVLFVLIRLPEKLRIYHYSELEELYYFSGFCHFTLIVYYLSSIVVPTTPGWVSTILNKENKLKEKYYQEKKQNDFIRAKQEKKKQREILEQNEMKKFIYTVSKTDQEGTNAMGGKKDLDDKDGSKELNKDHRSNNEKDRNKQKKKVSVSIDLFENHGSGKQEYDEDLYNFKLDRLDIF